MRRVHLRPLMASQPLLPYPRAFRLQFRNRPSPIPSVYLRLRRPLDLKVHCHAEPPRVQEPFHNRPFHNKGHHPSLPLNYPRLLRPAPLTPQRALSQFTIKGNHIT